MFIVKIENKDFVNKVHGDYLKYAANIVLDLQMIQVVLDTSQCLEFSNLTTNMFSKKKSFGKVKFYTRTSRIRTDD